LSGDAGSSNLASSLTDLMTSLAVIFVLLLAASLNNIRQEQESTVTSLRIILEKVLADFKKVGVEVHRDERDPLVLLVIVPENLFRFAFANADIPPGGLEFLKEFSPRLVEKVCSEELRDKIASIIVEGHADDRGSDKGNLDWSQQRSSAVVMESLLVIKQAEATGVGMGLSDCFKHMVSASGRGNAEPILDSEGHPDPDRSRRVIFKIRVRSFEQELTQVVTKAAPAVKKAQ
jgi:outer membrane protein OmpA-like peptidoglycan-associated protein